MINLPNHHGETAIKSDGTIMRTLNQFQQLSLKQSEPLWQ